MKRNFRIVAVFAVVIFAMIYLISSGLNNKTMVYYSTVKELKQKGKSAYGQGFRVSGKVVPGSIDKASDKIEARFVIEEEGERLQVVYHGILPDTFKEGSEVLVEGKYQPDDSFMATNVFTKCASKYSPAGEDQT
ncbi:MAG: cytochrome c maturation protein CcmE [Calditrichaeota bacterium]|nr:MAG: cytochrome c maturation protein CcmE [Calditrichota bacterium]